MTSEQAGQTTQAEEAPAPPAQEKALAKRPLETLRELLWQNRAYFSRVLPKHLPAERLIQVALAAAGRDDGLLACTPTSVLRSMMIAAQLGLDPSGVLGSGYLVPFRNNKTGRMEAQFIAGYRGLLDLARRSGEVVGAEAHVVYERDQFTFSFGIVPEVKHVPFLGDDRGQPLAAYAIVRLRTSPTPQIEIMSKAQIEKVRQASQAKNAGPWQTWWDEMARKSVLRRALKYAPLSADAIIALAVEERAEEGVTDVSDLLPELPAVAEEAGATQATTKADRLAQRLRGEAGAAAPQPPSAGSPPAPPAATAPGKRRPGRPRTVVAPAAAPPASELPPETETPGARAQRAVVVALDHVRAVQANPEASEELMRDAIDAGLLELGLDGRQITPYLQNITGKPGYGAYGPDDYRKVLRAIEEALHAAFAAAIKAAGQG